MSKYRCPVCGSPHREPVAVCRQCGQAMEEEIQPITRKSDPSVRERYRPKSVTPYILGGLVLVGVILVIAVAFGNADTTGPVGDALREIPVVGDNGDDGWEVFEEPTGAFSAELPTEPTQQDLIELSDQGETTAWVSPIADRMNLVVAYTTGAGLGTEDTVVVRLQPIADRFVAQTGGKYISDPVETTFAGYPALAFEIEDFQRDGDPAHLYGMVIQVGSEMVVAWTDSFEANPDQHSRLLDNLDITLGAPATTVPAG
jgi:hypothetical protein